MNSSTWKFYNFVLWLGFLRKFSQCENAKFRIAKFALRKRNALRNFAFFACEISQFRIAKFSKISQNFIIMSHIKWKLLKDATRIWPRNWCLTFEVTVVTSNDPKKWTLPRGAQPQFWILILETQFFLSGQI